MLCRAGLLQSISEVQGQLDVAQAKGDECGLLQAKLELFTTQANALTSKYDLGPISRPPVTPDQVASRERAPRRNVCRSRLLSSNRLTPRVWGSWLQGRRSLRPNCPSPSRR